jgi:hypothetical protein
MKNNPIVVCNQSDSCFHNSQQPCCHAKPHPLDKTVKLDCELAPCNYGGHCQPTTLVIVTNERELK